MRISFPYPDIPPLDIPDQNLLGVFSPSTVEDERDEVEIISEAFSYPSGPDRHRAIERM
jgi:hypothetical protein